MTVALVIITSLISLLSFSNRALFEKLELNPYKVHFKREYYRVITHAFVHADWIHLIINMFVLYSFGKGLEYYLNYLKIDGLLRYPTYIYYFTMYFTAIIIASLTTLKKFRDVPEYNAVGASGAVSAILFACIFFDPWQKLLFWAILPVPGILFGVVYLWYSHYMSRKNNDNINHDAHFLGALYGFTFPILLNPKLFYLFLNQFIHFHL